MVNTQINSIKFNLYYQNSMKNIKLRRPLTRHWDRVSRLLNCRVSTDMLNTYDQHDKS